MRDEHTYTDEELDAMWADELRFQRLLLNLRTITRIMLAALIAIIAYRLATVEIPQAIEVIKEAGQ